MRQTVSAMVMALATAALVLMGGCGEDTVTDGTAMSPEDGAVVEAEEAPEIEEAEPLEEAQNFTVPLVDGGEAQIEDYEGKILVLDFWATWCAACVKEFPAYQELYAGWDHDEVEYLGLSADGDMGTVKAFLEGRPEITLPMALASDELLDAYLPAGRTLPSSRVIDADGMIRYEFKGPGVEKVGEAVRRLLEEEEGTPEDGAAEEAGETEAATE
ncbi:MAG: TlpA family protein disulfide reductase [Armatimonadota bacterium]